LLGATIQGVAVVGLPVVLVGRAVVWVVDAYAVCIAPLRSFAVVIDLAFGALVIITGTTTSQTYIGASQYRYG
jgi:hypothetical protein